MATKTLLQRLPPDMCRYGIPKLTTEDVNVIYQRSINTARHRLLLEYATFAMW